MGNAGNITGWITFFFGLYAFAAGICEFRNPGFWGEMIGEVKRSKALRFLIGLFLLVLGAALFLVNPIIPKDWLAILITVLAAWIFIEGLLIMALGDWFLNFAGKMMGGGQRIWSIASILFGIAAIFVALVRLQV